MKKTDSTAELREMVSALDPAGLTAVSDDRLLAEALPVGAIIRRADAAEAAAAEAAAGSIAVPASRGSRRRVLRWGVPGTVVVLAGGAVAAAVVRDHGSASVTNVVRCYSVSHLTTDVRQYTDTALASTPGQVASDPSATVAAALDACSGLWAAGAIRPGVAGAPGGSSVVPPLVACVLGDGRAAVLPGDDQTCRRLGLARLADRGASR